MARMKIEFTEDQIKLIKNLRFERIEPKFFVEPCHEDVSVKNIGNSRYNISNIVKIDGKPIAESIAPIMVRNVSDFGDNLYGIDTYNLWGGTYIYEDIAYIIGKMDKVIDGTLEDPDGPKFDEETTQYMDELASFIIDNLTNIEEILHQFCTEGIQAGVVYTCKPNEHLWSKETKSLTHPCEMDE
jgi:hypothetical protein